MPNVKVINVLVLDRGTRLEDIPRTHTGTFLYTVSDFALAVPGTVIPVIIGNRCICLAKIQTINMELSAAGNVNTEIGFTRMQISDNEARAYYRLYAGTSSFSSNDAEESKPFIPGILDMDEDDDSNFQSKRRKQSSGDWLFPG